MYLLWTIWNWLQKFWGLNPDLFLAKFHIFYPFYYRTNSCFHWPKFSVWIESFGLCGLCKCDQVLKEPQIISDKFSFFFLVLPSAKLYFYWPTVLCESPHVKWESSARVGEALEMTAFIWNNLVLAPKSFRKFIPKYFWHIFSFYYVRYISFDFSFSKCCVVELTAIFVCLLLTWSRQYSTSTARTFNKNWPLYLKFSYMINFLVSLLILLCAKFRRVLVHCSVWIN